MNKYITEYLVSVIENTLFSMFPRPGINNNTVISSLVNTPTGKKNRKSSKNEKRKDS